MEGTHTRAGSSRDEDGGQVVGRSEGREGGTGGSRKQEAGKNCFIWSFSFGWKACCASLRVPAGSCLSAISTGPRWGLSEHTSWVSITGIEALGACCAVQHTPAVSIKILQDCPEPGSRAQAGPGSGTCRRRLLPLLPQRDASGRGDSEAGRVCSERCRGTSGALQARPAHSGSPSARGGEGTAHLRPGRSVIRC